MPSSMSWTLPARALKGLSRPRRAAPRTTRVLLKIYIYGNLNRVQSSWRLERECQRAAEVVEVPIGVGK